MALSNPSQGHPLRVSVIQTQVEYGAVGTNMDNNLSKRFKQIDQLKTKQDSDLSDQ